MPVSLAATSQTILIITAALLFYVGLADFKHYKIRNEIILVLAGLYFFHAALSGRWVTMHWNIGFAALLFVIMLHYYSMNLMGGGDLKLLTVAFLWTGPYCAIQFGVIFALFIGIYLLLDKFDWLDVKIVSGRRMIPLAPSIAAALICVFMIGCLHPL
jgi:prepilin peptidase CpaA